GIVLPASHLAGVHGDCQDADPSEYRKRCGATGDLLYQEQTMRTYLDETFDGLANIGFRVIVAYTGHYPEAQTRILQEAADSFTATGRSKVIPFWEPLACGDGDHGGKWETSIFMALAPAHARLDAIHDERTGQAGFYRGQD